MHVYVGCQNDVNRYTFTPSHRKDTVLNIGSEMFYVLMLVPNFVFSSHVMRSTDVNMQMASAVEQFVTRRPTIEVPYSSEIQPSFNIHDSYFHSFLGCHSELVFMELLLCKSHWEQRRNWLYPLKSLGAQNVSTFHYTTDLQCLVCIEQDSI